MRGQTPHFTKDNMFINPCSPLPSFASSMTKHSNDLRQLYCSIATEWLMRRRHWCKTLWTPERTSQEKTHAFYLHLCQRVVYYNTVVSLNECCFSDVLNRGLEVYWGLNWHWKQPDWRSVFFISDCNNGAIESVCVESTDHEALIALEWC